ncbi:hypothetical protein Bhyg_02482 [Pseudolycoriella hygida]|uniref:Uncharacterized protein n=1 Tax=Pseudolycoriella hygida TaxID=35572 RepID=A0A9Q0S8L0_9DIPT|nr:hypothetical protein Bhyg_02482 [Pseudolycoriella hygida]
MKCCRILDTSVEQSCDVHIRHVLKKLRTKLQEEYTGTVVMQVGFNTDASPLQPRIILLLESIKVKGVE